MTAWLENPVFGVTATLAAYYAASALYRRWKTPLLNPVLLSIAVLILFLKAVGIDYETYHRGGQVISFFLGPAVVALGVPLYRQWEAVKAQGWSIAASMTAGCLVGIISAAATALLLGASLPSAASLAPKSVTTPMAMGVSEALGGIPSLTAALVIAAGVFGAVAGPAFLRLLGVRSPTAFGLALGAAAHGIGTARALEEGPLPGASSGLALSLNGLATALTAPFLFRFLVFLTQRWGG